MNRIWKIILGSILLSGIISCQTDPSLDLISLDEDLVQVLTNASEGQGLEFFKFPSSDDLAKIPQDSDNPLTEAKIALGKFLYHETLLAIRPENMLSFHTYSCSSCHTAEAGFQANIVQGMGEGGMGFGIRGEGRTNHPAYPPEKLDVQPIRTPSSMNAAYQKVMFWNGQFGAKGMNLGTEGSWTAGSPKETNYLGYEGIETQAIAGLKMHRLKIDTADLFPYGYRELFDAAFPDVNISERYIRERAGLAIAAYERTLLSNKSPFQLWLQGNFDAMNEEEKKGAILFFDKAACYNCHTGPALNSMAFYALGMEDLNGAGVFMTNPTDVENKGRGGFTNRPEDMYKFKVPQLYNLKDSPFYGHGSSFRSIRDVIIYKNEAKPQKTLVPVEQLTEYFQPLNLSKEEIDQLSSFIETGLYDPELNRYKPETIPSGYCFPNNDAQSKIDLGCE